MADLDVALRLRLIDNVSGPARQAAQALRELDQVASGVHGRGSAAPPAVNPAGAPAAIRPPVARPAPVVAVPPPAPPAIPPRPPVISPLLPRPEVVSPLPIRPDLAEAANAPRGRRRRRAETAEAVDGAAAGKAVEAVEGLSTVGTARVLGLSLALGMVAGAAGGAIAALMEFANPAKIIAGLSELEAKVTNLERRLASTAVTAGMLDPAVIDRMRAENTQVGIAVGKTPEQVQPIRDVFSAAGYTLDQQGRILLPAAKAMVAMDATAEDIGQMTTAGMSNLNLGLNDMPAYLDIMAAGGQAGRFEGKDLAKYMPSLAAAYGAEGYVGLPAASEIAALATLAREGTGTSDDAGTYLRDFILKTSSPDAIENFAEYGVDLNEVKSQAKAAGKSPIIAVLEQIRAITGGDPAKTATLFQDQQVRQVLNAVIPRLDQLQPLIDKLGKDSTGTVEKSAQFIGSTAGGQQDQYAAIGSAGKDWWGKMWQPVATYFARQNALFWNPAEVWRRDAESRRQDEIRSVGGVAVYDDIVQRDRRTQGYAAQRDMSVYDREKSTIDDLIAETNARLAEAREAGKQAGEATGKGLDDGLKAASPAAEATLNGIVDKLKAIGNVTITPSIVPQMGVPSPSPSAPAPAGAPKVEPMSFRPEGRPEAVKRSADAGGARTFAQTNTIHVNGVSDPDATARAIERRLARLGNSSNLLLDTA